MATAPASSVERVGLLLAATGRRQTGGLGEQQPARLEQRAHDVLVDAAQQRKRVEPAGAPPVAHAHRVAVAHLDEPQLLEPLDRLADRRDVDVQVGRERPLRRQPLAGLVLPAEDRLAEAGEDLVGD